MDLYLTSTQIKKYNETGNLTLSNNCFKKPNVKLSLTPSQIKNVNALKNTKNTYEVSTSSKKGGFIPLMLIPPLISAAAYAGSKIYDSVNNKNTNRKLVDDERERTNLMKQSFKDGKPVVFVSTEKEAEKIRNGGSLKNLKKGKAVSSNDKVITKKGKAVSSNGKVIIGNGGITSKIIKIK